MRTRITTETVSPFSLVCRDCDAGMDIASEQHAAAEGWSQIDYAPGLPMANYVGLCPECCERLEHWDCK